MFIWQHQLKMDEAGEPTGGADALQNPENIRVELGIPHEVDDTPEEKVAAPVVKKEDPTDARVKGIETELATARRQLADVQASERYWAEQARLGTQRGDDDEEPSGAGKPVLAEPVIDETPEAFADDLLKRGTKAIKERGFVSKAEVARMVAEGLEVANENLKAARTDATFDTMLAQEFPDIAKDGARVRNGEEPQSEIYKRAAPIYRQMLKLDPQLTNSKSALIVAARQAAAEIKAEGKKDAPVDRTENSHEARRNAIARQRSDRSEGGGSLENDSTPTLTADQKAILRNLRVPEADFIKNSDRAAAGGRRGR